jgi:peptide/nickel transport system ATP-binding protein
MYAGKIVESGSVDDIFYRPLAPYTLGLLNSIPRAGDKKTGRLSAIAGQPPSLINLPTGCSFAPRCDFKEKVNGGLCNSSMPALTGVSSEHRSRCHLDEKERQKLFPTLAVK